MSKFDDYFDGARQYLFENPNQRRGQAFKNYLHTFDVHAYEMLHGSQYDPFYREQVFDRFLSFLRDLWAVSS